VSRAFWLHVPNMITLGRILCVPVMIWMILNHNLSIAFWVFVIAGASDALDGYLAKVMKARTPVGAFLDPIADKFLLVSAFVVLGVQELLPLWLVIMVVFRDLAIVVGATLIEILTHNLKMEPNLSSKINTFVQVVLAGTVLAVHGFNLLAMTEVIDGLVYLTACSVTVSGSIYLYYWGKKISQSNEEERV
jgi:cardiolipin synthase (CMP-forming)